ncbi:MAG: polyprenyl synthetase family protein [Bifidobacteriaceae bacterium]|jgi:heptaprenyl diphosphate synthase|nr:polyprenyl synthetase family protein [Bifidobacteriaceae bacterium]
MTDATLAISLADPDLQATLVRGLREVEARLESAVASSDSMVEQASSHLLKAGGKRLRPLLVLLGASLGRGVDQRVIDSAAVVELTHLASLYHDDVMDAAPLRRGTPSAHEVYGPSVAILTGDLLFARASQIVAGLGPEYVLIQAQTFERLCLGQIHETTGPAADEDPVAFHLSVLADKTGALIATSARFGAQLAGVPATQVEALVAYGEAVGVAFQLADDIIDLTSPTAVTGKTPGTDLREGVPTMPRLLVEAAARRDQAEGRSDSEDIRLAQDMAGDLSDDAVLAAVVDRLCANPALDEARALARSWANQALGHLDPLPAGPVKQALAEVADLFVRRLA